MDGAEGAVNRVGPRECGAFHAGLTKEAGVEGLDESRPEARVPLTRGGSCDAAASASYLSR